MVSFDKILRLIEGVSTGIFLITALQLIAGVFQGELGFEHFLAQFLSSLKCVAIIWTETKQGGEVVMRYFASHLPLLQ